MAHRDSWLVGMGLVGYGVGCGADALGLAMSHLAVQLAMFVVVESARLVQQVVIGLADSAVLVGNLVQVHIALASHDRVTDIPR